MYGYGYSYGYGLIGGNTYNPLINYDWSTTTAQEYKTDGVELNTHEDTISFVDSGYATVIGTNGGVFTIGEIFKIEVEVTNFVKGNIYIREPFSTSSSRITANGVYTYYGVAVGTNSLNIRADGSPTTCDVHIKSIQKVIQEPNKRYLKDIGSTPTYNASMYFGIGAYFNGVDQTITVPINATIQTALKRVNGVVTINETSQILTNYIISGLGVHKDYYLFTRLLTTAEKDSYTNTPELFYAMAQADSTCVLNMPMCETDKYVRNMKTYSVGATNLFTSGFSATGSSGATTIAITNGYSVIKPSGGFVDWIALTNTTQSTNADIKVSFTFNLGSGTVYPIVTSCYTTTGIRTLSSPYQIKEGYNEIVIQSWASTRLAYLIINQVTEAFVWNFTNIIVNALTGMYPITNYTSSVRDNAKNLQYGLQTCKFVRDGLGVIQTASDYLECDGSGYADTGWIPPTNTNFTIECIIELNPISMYQQNGSGNLADAKIHFGLWNDNKPYIQGRNSQVVYKPAITVKTIMCFTVVKEGSVNKLFINNELLSTQVDSQITESMPFILGKRSTFISKSPIRLFKVHNKELTQAEITANYNSYVAKGLLS